ncbi:MAG: FMN-binding protein [Treponema sp.]|nr:FMN-binding protein [Treponema sp.]
MKNYLFFLLLMVVFLSGCAVLAARHSSFNWDEFYEGTGQGYRGPVTVQVYLENGSITEIIIVDSAEDRLVGGAAMEELVDLVITYNSTDIDAISGATESSRGFLEAVQNAILKR